MCVYLDRVLLLNTMIDYLLLLTTAQVSGTPLRRGRFALAALWGGSYAVASFVWQSLNLWPFQIGVCVSLAMIAFGKEQQRWRLIALYVLASSSLAGILFAFSSAVGISASTGALYQIRAAQINWGILLLATGVFYILLEIIFRQTVRYRRSDLKPITIALEERKCRVRALHDTGNTLRSPMDGTQVLVAQVLPLRNLWSREVMDILLSDMLPQEKVAYLYHLGSTRFSLLPYNTVGGSGLLLAVRSDYIEVGRKRYPNTLIALSTNKLGASYQALWGGEEVDCERLEATVEMDPV